MNVAADAEGGLIAGVALAGVLGLLSAYGVRVALVGRIESSRLDHERGTALLGRYPIEAFHWLARATGRALSRAGVSPDALTLLSLVITAGTLPLAAAGRFEAAGALLLLGSSFDALDGVVARERRIASDAGEMLDAVVDRYADALSLAGLVLFYHDSAVRMLLVLAALVGSMMVSYARAKAEALGVSPPAGMMRRPERIAYLSAALLVGPAASAWLWPSDGQRPVTLAVVVVIALVSNISAMRLLTFTREELLRTGRGSGRVS